MKFLLCLFLSFFCSAFDGLYVYPRAWIGTADKPMVYLLHQTRDKNLELWIWDMHNNKFFKGLPAHFMPTLLTLLPDQSGISFLDRGRIRVKFFDKRSVMSIDIDSPLYDIISFSWIDKHSLYLCAKQYGNYAIFNLTITGEVEVVAQDVACDLVYPQKIVDSLFYIKQNKAGVCALMKTEYPLIPFLEDNNFNAIDTFTERVSRLLKKEGLPRSQQRQQDLLIEFDTIHSPIALSMISESNGFIVDYNNQHDDTLFSFDCYYSEQKEGRWGYKKIFSFTVPQCFVAGDSPERFIESLNPLLPCHSRGKIYFIDYVINVFVIFSYNLKTGEVKKEYSDKKHSFSPLFIGDLLLCGSSLF